MGYPWLIYLISQEKGEDLHLNLRIASNHVFQPWNIHGYYRKRLSGQARTFEGLQPQNVSPLKFTEISQKLQNVCLKVGHVWPCVGSGQ